MIAPHNVRHASTRPKLT